VFGRRHFRRVLKRAKFAAVQLTVRSSSHVPLRRPHCAPHRSASPLNLLADRRSLPGCCRSMVVISDVPMGLCVVIRSLHSLYALKPRVSCLSCQDHFRCRPLRSCRGSCVARWCIKARLTVGNSSGTIVIN